MARLTQKCPRCKHPYLGVWAVSRRDNKTMICPSCAKQEAGFDGGILNIQPGVRDDLKTMEAAWLTRLKPLEKREKKVVALSLDDANTYLWVIKAFIHSFSQDPDICFFDYNLCAEINDHIRDIQDCLDKLKLSKEDEEVERAW